MELHIAPDGTVHGVYTEAIALQALGRLAIRRASYVEPDAAGTWWADLSPVRGPRLGPFALRSAALAAEAHWLGCFWMPRAFPTSAAGPTATGNDSGFSSKEK